MLSETITIFDTIRSAIVNIYGVYVELFSVSTQKLALMLFRLGLYKNYKITALFIHAVSSLIAQNDKLISGIKTEFSLHADNCFNILPTQVILMQFPPEFYYIRKKIIILIKPRDVLKNNKEIQAFK